MGTPHQGGSGVNFGKLLVNIASIFVNTDDRILKNLERDSEWLQQQLGQYGPISSDFITKFAYEIYATPLLMGKAVMVVPRASAVVPGAPDSEPIGVPGNHLTMVKFPERANEGYRKISGCLRIMVRDAVDVINARWESEKRVKGMSRPAG
ncbi:MAG: hypothetical protein Q9164_005754 [Protoblastenia rupestris]